MYCHRIFGEQYMQYAKSIIMRFKRIGIHLGLIHHQLRYGTQIKELMLAMKVAL